MGTNMVRIIVFLICLTLSWRGQALSQELLSQESYQQQQNEQGNDDEPTNKVAFNFVDVDLPVVVKFISEVTGSNFIFDESLKGKVTIIAPTELSSDDAFRLFSAILELKGFTLLPSGVNAYKIVPQAKARQGGTPITTDNKPSVLADETYVARLIPLDYISAAAAQTFLKPLISKTGLLSYFGPGNIILVIDSDLNIQKLLTIIKKIDQPSRTQGFELVPLEYATASNVAAIITDAFTKGQNKRVKKGLQLAKDESISVVSDDRMNAVILIGDNKARKSQIRELIKLLDQPLPKKSGRTKVYALEYADAEEVAKVLQGLTKGRLRSSNRKGRKTGMTSTETGFSGNVVIMPHKTTNSLVIMAAPSDYASIVEIISQIDIRRRQVFVEALIAEVSIGKLDELGAKWRAAADVGGAPVAIGGFGSMDAGSMSNIITGLSALSFGSIGDFFTTTVTDPTSGTSTNFSVPGFAALFSINEFRNAFNVLSAPTILTSDNQEAEILVGENVPFISKQDTTASGITSNIVERTDVGILLRIKPRINESDYVNLDIYQEISAVPEQSETLVATIGPTITKRSAKTSVVVRSGETVVIGGLMRENESETIRRIPFLSDIPILGWLFKFRSKNKEKTNLLIILTPNIVADSKDLNKISIRKRKEYEEKSQQQVPVPTRVPDDR